MELVAGGCVLGWVICKSCLKVAIFSMTSLAFNRDHRRVLVLFSIARIVGARYLCCVFSHCSKIRVRALKLVTY